MSQIDDYITEIEEDTKVSELNMKDVQLTLPGIKHKWAGRQIRAKMRLSELYNERDKIKHSTVAILKSESPIDLSDAAAERMADKHTRVQEIRKQIQDQKLIIELLEKAERIFNSMTFDVKNMIEIIKLETQ